MKKKLFCICLLFIFCANSILAQKHYQNSGLTPIMVEYWVDNYEKQYILTNDSDISFAVDASLLNEGMHILNYRVKDNDGMSCPLQTWMFVRTALQDTTIRNDAAIIEYWFDDNTSVRQTFMAENDTISFSINASSLNPGLHTLNYRAKDLYGNYSHIQTWAVFKGEPAAQKISWYKYWWNNHEDKAVKEFANDSIEFVFEKELIVPDYAMTDGFSANSAARFHIVFCDDRGNLSNVLGVDIVYPDVVPPISYIEADKEQAVESVHLTWKANEDNIESYNIYYSENDQPFVLWLPNTTKETATFKGQPGTVYRFTVTAHDKAGNRELFDESKNVKVVFISN